MLFVFGAASGMSAAVVPCPRALAFRGKQEHNPLGCAASRWQGDSQGGCPERGADLVLRPHARLHLHAFNHLEAERSHYSLLACALLWLHQNASMCDTAALATHAYDLVVPGAC